MRRLRAVIQEMNIPASNNIRRRGHKYHIDRLEAPKESEMPCLKLKQQALILYWDARFDQQHRGLSESN